MRICSAGGGTYPSAVVRAAYAEAWSRRDAEHAMIGAVAADPTDAAIEGRLRAAPDEAWRELAEALDVVEAQPVYAVWRGGEPVVTTVDGVERVARQAPYPEYTEAVERFRRALGGVRAVVVFAWTDWDGLLRYRTPDDVAAGTAADAVRLVTATLRAERFGDGSIEASLRAGLLTAAARRLLRWRRAG